MKNYVQWLRGFVGHAPIQVAGASVIIFKDGKALLQKRKDDGTWGYHGGAVELGENVEAAARRELFEETGLTAGEMTLFGVFSGDETYHKYPNGDEVYYVDVVYVCSDFSGEALRETDETTDLRWFPLSAPPAPLNPTIKLQFSEFIRRYSAN